MTYGPEIWPQPDFSDDTGLSLDNATISDNALHFAGAEEGAQICAMASPPEFGSGDVYHYMIQVDDYGGVGSRILLQISDAQVIIGPGFHQGYVAVTTTSLLRFRDASGARTASISSCSIRKYEE